MPALLPATEDHPHARAVLDAAVPPAGNPSHAYLFHGPAGAGKRDAARQFAAALLADGAQDAANAARRAIEGVHPDLTWVVPSGANVLVKADIDEAVVAASTHTPFESRRRVFVIEGAHTMNDAAANRMLKTLEEPPSFAHLILLTDRIGEVLPTIRSRCQAVRFEAPTVQKLADRLASRVPPDQAEACARLALGDGERALMLALGEGPALRAGAERLARACIAQDLAGRPWTALLERAGAHGEGALKAVEDRLAADLPFLPVKEQARAKREATDTGKRAQRRARIQALDQALGLVGLWLRDVAVTVDGAPELVHHSDRADAVAQDAAGFANAHGLRAGVDLVDETRFALREVNATEDLAVEALAFRLERAVATR
ncbi:clamp loader of DNA polymerase [Paraconexibacter sp. AEG42_29]|uniref:Clamp loader of DNA polymerase n=1 Tax=Paraconexibacter sp. AEG42_29 TaxID=2997339 RepID=A0AAU7B1Y1_9ACTN